MKPVLLAVAVCAGLIAGCGGDDSDEAATEPPAAPSNGSAAEKAGGDATGEEAGGGEAAGGKPGATVKVVDSEFGRVLADRQGQALYLFDKEGGPKSECYDDCAAAWPPLITKGKPKVGGDARGNLLGTTKRRDGQLQVTYRGHPLYYYVDDAPGKILCHDVAEFGGQWLVVKPDGNAVS